MVLVLLRLTTLHRVRSKSLKLGRHSHSKKQGHKPEKFENAEMAESMGIQEEVSQAAI